MLASTIWSWVSVFTAPVAAAPLASTPAATLIEQLVPGLVVGIPGGLLLWYGLRKNAREAASAPADEGPLRLGFATIVGALASAAGALAVVDVLAQFVRGALFP